MTRSFLICGISDDQYPVLFGDKAEDVKARITTGLQAAEKQFVDAGCPFKLVKLAPVEADVAKWEQYVSEAQYDGIVMFVRPLPAQPCTENRSAERSRIAN